MWMVQIGDLACEEEQPHARVAELGELLPTLRSLALVS
jgi:hypothetical protein